MLALGFLIMIGMTLIAEGFGAHVPKGYIYTPWPSRRAWRGSTCSPAASAGALGRAEAPSYPTAARRAVGRATSAWP